MIILHLLINSPFQQIHTYCVHLVCTVIYETPLLCNPILFFICLVNMKPLGSLLIAHMVSIDSKHVLF